MSRCHVLASGRVEQYFYGELEFPDEAAIRQHLAACAECRAALEDLSIIRSALAARPSIGAPPGGDWSAFMQRLDASVAQEREPAGARAVPARLFGRGYPAYVAAAALLALVTTGVIYVARLEPGRLPADATIESVSGAPPDAVVPVADREALEDAFASLSEQHFDRSKLVVLGLASKDPDRQAPADWAYERELAAALLADTRLYRQTAEQRGLGALAGVMGDLELVLLQAAHAERMDEQTLEQMQRFIRKRDLVTRMNVIAGSGF